jgi:chromosome segregation ATPase
MSDHRDVAEAREREADKWADRLAALERELADERSARQSSVTALEAIRVDAEQRSEKAQKELYRQNVKLKRELAEARTAYVSVTDQLSAEMGRAEILQNELAAARAEVTRLRKALVGIVGADTPEELDQMEAVIRMAPAPAEDKAASIDAIHALRARREP